MVKLFCWLCASETTKFHDIIESPFGKISRDIYETYSTKIIESFRVLLKKCIGTIAFNEYPCIEYDKHVEMLKSRNKKSAIKKGNRTNHNCLHDECYKTYKITYFYYNNMRSKDNKGLTEILKSIYIKKDNNNRGLYKIIPQKSSNREFSSTLNRQLVQNKDKNELRRARDQFKKVVELIRSYLMFISESFENHDFDFYLESTSSGSICEFGIQNGIVSVKEKEVVKDNGITLICYDLWSLLSTIDYDKVRQILRPLIKIPCISTFYEDKHLIDTKLVMKKIIMAVKIGKINGMMIDWEMIFKSIVYDTDNIIEMGINCLKKVNHLINSNSLLKRISFKSERIVQFLDDINIVYEGTKYNNILIINFPVGEGPDETPFDKKLIKNKYTAMLDVFQGIDSDSPMGSKFTIPHTLLAYPGKLNEGLFKELFEKRISSQIKKIESSIFVKNISSFECERIIGKLVFGDVIVLIRFHFHICADELQFQISSFDDNSKNIKTRISIDTGNNDRMKLLYKQPDGKNFRGVKINKHLKGKDVEDMELNVKVLKYLLGEINDVLKDIYKPSNISVNHIYDCLKCNRIHIDHVVHCPKRWGVLYFSFLNFIFKEIIFKYIKNIVIRNKVRVEYVTILYNRGLIDKSLIIDRKNEINWSSFDKHEKSISNLSEDKTKLLIGITKKKTDKLIENLKYLIENKYFNDIEPICVSIVGEWLDHINSIFENERFIHKSLSSETCLNLDKIGVTSFKIDKASIFAKNICPLVKTLPRYVVYRGDKKSTLYDLLENGDTGSFGCGGKEAAMKTLREFYERSPKFSEIGLYDLTFFSWTTGDVIMNDKFLNTVFSIITHWMMKNPILRNIYVNCEAVDNTVKVISLCDEKAVECFKKIDSIDRIFFQFLGGYDFPENDDMEVIENEENDEMEICNNTFVDTREFQVLKSYDNRIYELIGKTTSLIKERKAKQIALNCDTFFQSDIYKNMRDIQKNYSKDIFPKLKAHINGKLELNTLPITLFWAMATGKTYQALSMAITWFHHLKYYVKNNPEKPVIIIITPLGCAFQWKEEVEKIFDTNPLKRILCFQCCDVKSVKKLCNIYDIVSRKGGIIIMNPEKMVKMKKLIFSLQLMENNENSEPIIPLGGAIPISTDDELVIDVYEEDFVALFAEKSKSLIFKKLYLFMITDEIHKVLTPDFSSVLDCFTPNVACNLTGTPLIKYGETLYNILKVSLNELFMDSFDFDMTSLVKQFEKIEKGEVFDEDEVKENCLKVRKHFKRVYPYITIHIKRENTNRDFYLLFFPLSEDQKKSIDICRTEIIARKPNFSQLSLGRFLLNSERIDKLTKVSKDTKDYHSGCLYFINKFTKYWKKENKKTVIFSEFNKNLKFLKKVLQVQKIKNDIFIYSGEISSTKSKMKMVKSFINCHDFDVLELNIKAGGLGLNLHIGPNRCVLAIIQDLPWNNTDLEQCICRIDRDNERITILSPLCIDSVDKINCQIICKLFLKKNLNDLVFSTIDPKLVNLILDKNFIWKCIGECCLLNRSQLIGDPFLKDYLSKTNYTFGKKEYLKVLKIVKWKDLFEQINGRNSSTLSLRPRDITMRDSEIDFTSPNK